jgi:ubiquinone/menaquinone biosynthesis C-methylase UbiE
MDESLQTVKADFDRIALLSSDDADHNQHYFNFLLQHVPPRCSNALEIGCGTGAFSRLLAQRADRVIALDFSPNMIRLARVRSREHKQIDFQCADATLWDFPRERFDFVVSIATLHHLPMKAMLNKMKRSLRPHGTLAVLDLYQTDGAFDAFTSLLAMLVSVSLRLWKTGKLRAAKEVREAWAEHGRHDSYLTLPDIREMCAAILPEAAVRRHLLWRYSIIWQKPGESSQSE